MRLLLDTHTLLWFAESDPQLSRASTAYLVDPANDLFLSPASYWELAFKVGLGKYRLTRPLADYMNDAIGLYGLTVVPITVAHAAILTTLPHHHRDPFDRLLIAQAMAEGLTVIGADAAFDAYPIIRVW